MNGCFDRSMNCPEAISAAVPVGFRPVVAGGKALGVGGNWASTSTFFDASRLFCSVGQALAAVGAVCSWMCTPGCCCSKRASTFFVCATAAGLVHSAITRVCDGLELVLLLH